MQYPWWERWGDLRLRPFAGPIGDLGDLLDVAAWFIDEYAPEAEAYGWRPVHILRPGLGLAWRWRLLPRPALAITEAGIFARWHPRTAGLSFVYRPQADGTPLVLMGQQREVALAGF